MHKQLTANALLLLLFGCGGGSESNSSPPPPPASPPPAEVGGGAIADVPNQFDFSNFVQHTVTFSVPDDLFGQVNFKLTATWDNKIQDLYLGRSQAGNTESVNVNIPTIIETITVEYLAYDIATDTAQVKIVEVAL